MKHRFCITLAILALFAVLPALRAQANPTAIQRGTIQAGVTTRRERMVASRCGATTTLPR
jgi:hypothetical protein